MKTNKLTKSDMIETIRKSLDASIVQLDEQYVSVMKEKTILDDILINIEEEKAKLIMTIEELNRHNETPEPLSEPLSISEAVKKKTRRVLAKTQNNPLCPTCKSYSWKNGTKNGIQNYKCKNEECALAFNLNTKRIIKIIKTNGNTSDKINIRIDNYNINKKYVDEIENAIKGNECTKTELKKLLNENHNISLTTANKYIDLIMRHLEEKYPKNFKTNMDGKVRCYEIQMLKPTALTAEDKRIMEKEKKRLTQEKKRR